MINRNNCAAWQCFTLTLAITESPNDVHNEAIFIYKCKKEFVTLGLRFEYQQPLQCYTQKVNVAFSKEQ